MDSILKLMIQNRVPLTLANYVHIARMGNKTVEDLEAEELAEIPDEILLNTRWVQ